MEKMYIHRVAIDTNSINAKQNSVAMNQLESMHRAGLIEIVRTSTMAADLKTATGPQPAKAAQYDVIYSDTLYLTGTGFPDTQTGPALRKSRFCEIYEGVFGIEPNGQRRGPRLTEQHPQSIRDALHIDQCWQNMVDYFVTCEKRLHQCPNLDFVVCDAEECLEGVRTYFRKAFGTTEIVELSKTLNGLGPVILGSNSIGPFECRLPSNGESLLRVDVNSSAITVSCTIRGKHGEELVKVFPNLDDFEFNPGDCGIGLMAGPSPLKLGTKSCKSFAITSGDEALLAGRLVWPGRLVLFEAILRWPDGRDALRIHRHLLGLHGSELRVL